MNDEKNGEEHIATLLRLAGRRPSIDAEREARVRAAVHCAWQAERSARQRNRWLIASAAAVLIAFGVLFSLRREAPVTIEPKRVVATLQGAPRSIRAGESMTTAADTASLQWGDATLRLDTATAVRFTAANELTLERGAIYFSGHGAAVVVRTPFGVVHDIGTQFEVRLASNAMRVRVREGRVDIERDGVRRVAGAGSELSVDATGAIAMRPIDSNDPQWDWVVRAAPPFALEGRTLGQVVDNVAAEKGLGVRWPGDVARDIELHGSTPLSPDEALDAALAASGLEARVEGNRLIVERAR